MTGAVSE